MRLFSFFEFKFRDFSFGHLGIRNDLEEMFDFIALERAFDLEELNKEEVFFNEFDTKQVFLYDLDFDTDLPFEILPISFDFDVSIDTNLFYTIVDDFEYDDDFFLDLNLFCLFIFFFFSFYYFLLIYSIIILLIEDLEEYSDEQMYDHLDFLYDDYDLTHYFYSDFFFEDVSFFDFLFFFKCIMFDNYNKFFYSQFNFWKKF